jgi:signal transduction histidine kinase
LKKRWPIKRVAAYAALLASALAIALVAGWTALAARIDNSAYDFFFNLYPPAQQQPQSAVLAVDEATLNSMGGVRKIRTILAKGLESIAPAAPKAVAIDFLLPDQSEPGEDQQLAQALAEVHSLVLSCELLPGGWEDPIPAFRTKAAALGHVHAESNSLDGISRMVPLEKSAFGARRWALALEAFRLARGNPIIESPDDLQVGRTFIPAPESADGRPLRIRWQRPGPPVWSVRQLVEHPELAANFRDKAVFIGYTALSYVRDRLLDPYGEAVQGVVIHAQAFETLQQGQFLVPASDLTVVGCCVLLAVAAGLIFGFLSGWPAYMAAAVLLVAAHGVPALLFRNGIIFPYFLSISASWLPISAAAAFQYFVVRRDLRKSESDKTRYQQAIHFVTHEMRTPLTAIQGSSELMGRYNLTEEKRKQIAGMIHSESKRLASMIQTFLDVERLTEGQMNVKRESFPVRELIQACVGRARPIAGRKSIELHEGPIAEADVNGDRELMEYALYNLLTNAVKYSPADRHVSVGAVLEHEFLRISVQDQGIGMDAKEIKSIFRKFYRTKKAEASGEVGTGIGLSIVEQIVTHHGGRMEVESTPGFGSTFTIVVPAQVRARSESTSVRQAGSV